MITIVTTSDSFDVTHWLSFRPVPQVIWMGNPTIRSYCEDHGIIHFPNIRCYDNVPYLSAAIRIAEAVAIYKVLLVVTPDIVIDDVLEASVVLLHRMEKFLASNGDYLMFSKGLFEEHPETLFTFASYSWYISQAKSNGVLVSLGNIEGNYSYLNGVIDPPPPPNKKKAIFM